MGSLFGCSIASNRVPYGKTLGTGSHLKANKKGLGNTELNPVEQGIGFS